jgi:hypothetical protein
MVNSGECSFRSSVVKKWTRGGGVLAEVAVEKNLCGGGFGGRRIVVIGY